MSFDDSRQKVRADSDDVKDVEVISAWGYDESKLKVSDFLLNDNTCDK